MEKFPLLFESVFKKDNTGEDTIDFLEKITGEYPYFSTAQFYLLHSLKKDKPEYIRQVKQTAVIFNNNHWLNFQLLEAGRPHTLTVDQQKFAIEEDILPVNKIMSGEDYPVNEDALEEKQFEPALAEGKEDQLQAKNINEKDISETDRESTKPPADPVSREETIYVEDSIVVTDKQFPEQPFPDELIIPNESKEDAVITDQEPALTENESNNSLAESRIDSPQDNTSSELPEEKEIPSIRFSLEQPANIPDNAILFEPLHTTDYFASVGIKLSEEAKAGDKLGKQLKSFTEWLKTMKKIHTEQLTRASTADEIEADNTESNIQQLAEKSNIEGEVITEAMAEVLVQQGRINKAVEVLEKLSLLDPGKSAYFAAKISQIKAP